MSHLHVRKHQVFIFAVVVLVTLLLLSQRVAMAQVTVSASLDPATPSFPTFDGANWSDLKVNRVQPSQGGIVVFYPNTSGQVYPLQNGAATAVRLWTGEENVADPIAGRVCAFVPTADPVPGTLDACFYKVLVNRVEIYLNGNLAEGQPIRYTIAESTAAPWLGGDDQQFRHRNDRGGAGANQHP